MTCDSHTLEVYGDFGESLCALWNQALLGMDHLTIFQSRAWLQNWCSVYKDIDALRIYVERGKCGAYFILPMMEYRGALRTLAYSATDYSGTIYPPSSCCTPHQLASELLSEARRTTVELAHMSPRDPVVEVLEKAGTLIMVERVPILRCDLRALRAAGTCLPLSRKAQRDVARNCRNLQRLGANFELDIANPSRLLDAMVAVHTRRWNLKGEPGNFADTRRVDFVHRLLADHNIPVQVSVLSLDSTLLAYRISFPWNRVLAAWNSGMNSDFGRFSPGTVLQAAELGAALHGGFDTYDMLRGAEAYKIRWANDRDAVFTYKLVAS